MLARLVHGCSGVPAGRTAAVTTLVLSLWQLAGPGMTPTVPSLILLDASGADADPLDGFAARLVAPHGDVAPQTYHEGAFAGGTPEHAPAAMAGALRMRQESGNPASSNAWSPEHLEALYFAAQKTGFGYGTVRPYARVWHDVFGLLTNRDDRILLRLDAEEDRAAFRRHVLETPDTLRSPFGYGAGLSVVAKEFALSGSLASGQWDRELAEGIVDLGLAVPLVLLPHAAGEAPLVENTGVLDYLTGILPRAFVTPVKEPANLPPVAVFEDYGERLRARLRHLPATFEYVMQRAVRQLYPVCVRLGNWAGRLTPGVTPEEIEALVLDLYGHTLRGLVIAVAGLAWHGLGFDPGVPRPVAARALAYLRVRGAMTRSDFLRGAHLGKAERDVLLERLAAEDLVRLDAKTVEAATFREFVDALYARDEFPEPENHWAALEGNDKGSA